MRDLKFLMEARGFLSPLDEEMFFEWMNRLRCKGEYTDQDRKLAIRLSEVPNQEHLCIAHFIFLSLQHRSSTLTRVAGKLGVAP
jgi:hypothetical protein